MTLDEAAATLALSASSARRLIQDGHLPAQQFCKGAPWIIKVDDLSKKEIIQAADKRRARRPSSDNLDQKTLAI